MKNVVGLYSCYNGHMWLNSRYPSMCPVCGEPGMTEDALNLSDLCDMAVDLLIRLMPIVVEK